MKEYYTRKHKIIELLAWFLILLSCAVAIYGILTLPPTIATHFNVAGDADGYGSPATLLIMPIIMSLPLALTSLIVHFHLNYSLNINKITYFISIYQHKQLKTNEKFVNIYFIYELFTFEEMEVNL